MTDIRVTQGFVLAAAAGANVRVFQTYVLAAGQRYAEEVDVSQGFVNAAVQAAMPVRVQQAVVMVACKGKLGNPKVRAWTYSLDNHDFYVLQLGTDGVTLVYDLSTEQWAIWGDGTTEHWRAGCGLNWGGSRALAYDNGSDVIVGDDQAGVLYFLDPNFPYDDERSGTPGEDFATFRKVATGQLLAKGLDGHSCGIVRLMGSFGDAYESSLNTVELQYSDDFGRTYVSAGSVTLVDGVYNPRVEWRSLGSIKAPGRTFKVIDFGGVARIDTLEIINE